MATARRTGTARRAGTGRRRRKKTQSYTPQVIVLASAFIVIIAGTVILSQGCSPADTINRTESGTAAATLSQQGGTTVNNGKIVLPTNTRPAPDDVYGTEAVPTSAPAHSSVDSISTGASTTTTATAPKQTVAPQKPSTAQQNPTSISEPTTIDGVIIVNKSYALPSTYNPNKLSTETQKAFDEMNAVAKSKGLSLWIASGFRSYESQKSIYERNLAAYGQAKTDTFSARPGFSEHQTGLAFDLNTIDDSFAYTSEGVWVVANAHKYGFIIRYPKDKEHITGYKYEPWHLRYVGKELAQTLYNRDQTLEEYFNITSVYANAEYKSN